MRTFRLVLTCSLIALALGLTAYPASADGVYPTQHIKLAPVNSFPLRSGFVVNIHANGPIIFAHENYVLNGASPNTAFDVYLLVHVDELCTVQIAELNTTSFTTNVAGNGKGQAVFSPDMAPHEMTLYMQWELRSEGIAAYRTECSMVVLD